MCVCRHIWHDMYTLQYTSLNITDSQTAASKKFMIYSVCWILSHYKGMFLRLLKRARLGDRTFGSKCTYEQIQTPFNFPQFRHTPSLTPMPLPTTPTSIYIYKHHVHAQARRFPSHTHAHSLHKPHNHVLYCTVTLTTTSLHLPHTTTTINHQHNFHH